MIRHKILFVLVGNFYETLLFLNLKFIYEKNEIKIARNGFYQINNYVPARGLCELHHALNTGII